MSKLREAARRALTALNIFHGAVTDTDWKMDFQPEIDALRAVLAEPDETEAAVLAEREACAQAAGEWLPDSFDEITQVAIAAAIRARGQE